MSLILSTLLWIYIGVAGLFTLMFVLALIKVGSFQEFANRGNKLYGHERYNEFNIQWYMLFIVIGWPIIAIMVLLTPRQVG